MDTSRTLLKKRYFSASAHMFMVWQRLWAFWLRHETVQIADDYGEQSTQPEHVLCELFVEAFPNCRELLFGELGHPQPQIAAYAFKCLTLMGPLTRDDIPPEVLERSQEIFVETNGVSVPTSLALFIEARVQGGDPERRLGESQRSRVLRVIRKVQIKHDRVPLSASRLLPRASISAVDEAEEARRAAEANKSPWF